jgi:hypothetical protein
MRLALHLLLDLLLLPLPALFLSLVTIIIGTVCNKVISLTAFEAGALSPYFVLVGVLLASFKSGLEALDDERPFILIEPGSLYVAELSELFQLKCLSPALDARPHLNGNNPSIPRI